MVCAKTMGMSEDEFWNSCPIFFNECFEKYMEIEQKRGGVRIG